MGKKLQLAPIPGNPDTDGDGLTDGEEVNNIDDPNTTWFQMVLVIH